MDFKNYYLNQASGNDNVFRGVAYQKGYGLGGAFKRFFSWALPLIKENLKPTVSNIGKELISGVSNLATDAIQGKNLEHSAKERFKQGVKNLGGQVGEGYKRKRNLKKRARKKKRTLDIFD